MTTHVARLGAASLAAMLLSPVAQAQELPAAKPDKAAELATLKAELAAQRELVNRLMRELQAQRAKIERIEERRDDARPVLAENLELPPRVDDLLLSEQRGTGGQNGGAPAQASPQNNQQNPNNAPRTAQNGNAPNNGRPPSTPAPVVPGPAPAQPAARPPAQASTASRIQDRKSVV